MIFAALLGVGLQSEPMKWTGEVKAFAHYSSSECKPQQRLYTIYAARKVFEDGSTTTIVRMVPSGQRVGPRAYCQAQGIIERDSAGSATHIGTQFAFAPFSERNLRTSASEFNADPKTGTLVGWGSVDDIYHSKNLVLPQPKTYFLDPIEALAFGSKASMASGWLLPAGTYGYTDGRTKVVGLKVDFSRARQFAHDLNGKREMFLRVDLTRNWIGSTIAKVPEVGGSLLFRQDGSLAAYVPVDGVVRLPSTVLGGGQGATAEGRPVQPPPFALTGELAKAWEKGPDVRLRQTLAFDSVCGVCLPTSVSASESAAVLASIPDKEKPKKEGPVGDPDSGLTIK